VDRLSRPRGEAASSRDHAALSVKVAGEAIAPGETTTVEVYASKVSDFRTYEVSLAVTGGESGRLTIENPHVDTRRADFVFQTSEKITAEDRQQVRLGGVLFSGGVNVTRRAYLGTFTLRASADASGTFNVNLQEGPNSFLGDSRNRTIGFHRGADATIMVREAR
jgi:hypothetical protein